MTSHDETTAPEREHQPVGVQMCACGQAHPLTATGDPAWNCPRQLGADAATRDDLARDVAQLWGLNTSTCGGPGGIALGAALDRLVAAYGVTR